LGVDPDGSNINQGCGALFPEGLQAAVRRHGAHAGLALDGDADRAIFVDEQGQVVDGDAVMAILADDLRARGELKRSTLVATVMSNLGLHVAMRERGIEVVTTPVGDRYVVEEMVRGGYNLGGEQSGHIVFLHHNTTGDGLITALALLALLVEKGRPFSELRRTMRRLPRARSCGSGSTSITSRPFARRAASTTPTRSRRRSPPRPRAPTASRSTCARTAATFRSATWRSCAAGSASS